MLGWGRKPERLGNSKAERYTGTDAEGPWGCQMRSRCRSKLFEWAGAFGLEAMEGMGQEASLRNVNSTPNGSQG